MQQIKLFKGVETEISALEKEVNEWIQKSGARVIQISGNISPQSVSPASSAKTRFVASDVMLIVLYEVSSG
jgi:hypothetical protein